MAEGQGFCLGIFFEFSMSPVEIRGRGHICTQSINNAAASSFEASDGGPLGYFWSAFQTMRPAFALASKVGQAPPHIAGSSV